MTTTSLGSIKWRMKKGCCTSKRIVCPKTGSRSTLDTLTRAARGKAGAKKSSRTATDMRANGKMTWRTGKADTIMRTATYTRASGKTIRRMAMVNTSPATVAAISANGRTICSTGKDRRAGLTNHRTTVIIRRDRNMAKVPITTAMARSMKAGGQRT